MDEFKLVQGPDIFYIQPPTQQWINVAEDIKRSFCIKRRATKEITHTWYGNSHTNRIAGVGYTVEPHKIECESEWKKAVRWMTSEFSFLSCQICFRIFNF